MLAVGGFAKAMPPDPSGYDFSNAGAQETRFSGIKWLQSNYRAAWRWNDEALYTDLDGSFADQEFCGGPNMGVGQNPNLPETTGCHVLKNSLVENTKSFPDCYHDERYGGPVCKPNYHFVEAGFIPEDPLMMIKSMRLSNRDTNGDGSGLYVRETDTAFLRNKWRPHGSYQLVEMDVATDVLKPRVVGEGDKDWISPDWKHPATQAEWTGPRSALFKFKYEDRFNGHDRELDIQADFSEDGSTLSFVNGTSLINGSQQLFTHVTWYRCELLPKKCTEGAVRYPDFASMSPVGMNMANTPHFRGSKFHTQLIMGRRYQLDVKSAVGIMHPEKTTVHIGQAMTSGEWLEIATNPLAAYPKTHVPPGIRPIGALPQFFKMSIDGQSNVAKRAFSAARETFAGRRRRLMGSSISYDDSTERAIMRFEGPPNCYVNRWFDPCGGAIGEFDVAFAPPPSPPPPSPPLPPPPPPAPPPSPPPPAEPRGFSARVTVGIPAASLGSISADAFKESVSTRLLNGLSSASEKSAAAFTPTVLVEGLLSLSISGDVSDATLQEQVRQAAHDKLCAGRGPSCAVSLASATASRRRGLLQWAAGRRLASGTIVLRITQDLYEAVAPSPPSSGGALDGGLTLLVPSSEEKLSPEVTPAFISAS